MFVWYSESIVPAVFYMVSAVYRGDEAKPSVQTCTCVHRTCNGCGVTGDRYGVVQSHPRCDPCYTLGVPPPKPMKGKNRARLISPINVTSDDEIPVDSSNEK